MDRKTAFALGLAGLIGALYISVSATFIVLLLGLLVVPPMVAVASAFREGASMASKELKKTQ